MKIEIESLNWKLNLIIGIENLNWELTFKIEIENSTWNWQVNLDTVFISEKMST